jgi:hypothetical protein
VSDSKIQVAATVEFVPNKERRDVSGIILVMGLVFNLFLTYVSFPRKRQNIAVVLNSICVSYSEGPRIKYMPGDRQYFLSFSWFSSLPQYKVRDRASN